MASLKAKPGAGIGRRIDHSGLDGKRDVIGERLGGLVELQGRAPPRGGGTGSEELEVLRVTVGKGAMPSGKRRSEVRKKDAGEASDAAPTERERQRLKHELVNLQQMNLSLQAVLQLVVSFKKTIEEVIENSDHLAELNEGWSAFFRVQKSRIQN